MLVPISYLYLTFSSELGWLMLFSYQTAQLVSHAGESKLCFTSHGHAWLYSSWAQWLPPPVWIRLTEGRLTQQVLLWQVLNCCLPWADHLFFLIGVKNHIHILQGQMCLLFPCHSMLTWKELPGTFFWLSFCISLDDGTSQRTWGNKPCPSSCCFHRAHGGGGFLKGK